MCLGVDLQPPPSSATSSWKKDRCYYLPAQLWSLKVIGMKIEQDGGALEPAGASRGKRGSLLCTAYSLTVPLQLGFKILQNRKKSQWAITMYPPDERKLLIICQHRGIGQNVERGSVWSGHTGDRHSMSSDSTPRNSPCGTHTHVGQEKVPGAQSGFTRAQCTLREKWLHEVWYNHALKQREQNSRWQQNNKAHTTHTHTHTMRRYSSFFYLEMKNKFFSLSNIQSNFQISPFLYKCVVCIWEVWYQIYVSFIHPITCYVS